MNADRTVRLKAWDPLVRLTHWGIALAVLANAVLTEEGSSWHVWVGTALAALLVLRLLWGLIGPAEARFSAFPPSPGRAVRHVRDLLAGRREPHRSHNGLGALMVYALWAVLAVIAFTGLSMSGFPPAAEQERVAMAPAMAGGHEEEEREEEAGEGRREGGGEGEEWMEEVHEAAVNLLYVLIALHIAGVMLETVRMGPGVLGRMTGRGDG